MRRRDQLVRQIGVPAAPVEPDLLLVLLGVDCHGSVGRQRNASAGLEELQRLARLCNSDSLTLAHNWKVGGEKMQSLVLAEEGEIVLEKHWVGLICSIHSDSLPGHNHKQAHRRAAARDSGIFLSLFPPTPITTSANLHSHTLACMCSCCLPSSSSNACVVSCLVGPRISRITPIQSLLSPEPISMYVKTLISLRLINYSCKQGSIHVSSGGCPRRVSPGSTGFGQFYHCCFARVSLFNHAIFLKGAY